jgi:hypothetical protein
MIVMLVVGDQVADPVARIGVALASGAAVYGVVLFFTEAGPTDAEAALAYLAHEQNERLEELLTALREEFSAHRPASQTIYFARPEAPPDGAFPQGGALHAPQPPRPRVTVPRVVGVVLAALAGGLVGGWITRRLVGNLVPAEQLTRTFRHRGGSIAFKFPGQTMTDLLNVGVGA